MIAINRQGHHFSGLHPDYGSLPGSANNAFILRVIREQVMAKLRKRTGEANDRALHLEPEVCREQRSNGRLGTSLAHSKAVPWRNATGN